MTRMSRERLSQLVSHALRHEPWLYELELDDDGWVLVEALLAAIQEQGPRWVQVDRAALIEMIASSTKRRHEIDGERVRALYGHSVPGRVAKIEADPPAVLFHGTSLQAWQQIQRSGLRPMGRQFVHLSVDAETAEQVGARKSANPMILTVDAVQAHRAGTRFWDGNGAVWLADYLAPEFLTELGSGSSGDVAQYGHRATALVRLHDAERARLLDGVLRSGSRSMKFRFPAAGEHVDGDVFGAVIEEVAAQPDGQLRVHLWFWNDVARVYVTPGARFEVWYVRTSGEGVVLH